MSLPVLNAPVHTLEIPSTKKVIKYRPFLVKEEKLLLMAKESQETSAIIDVIKQIIENCTFNEVDSSLLTTFDIEYMFLQIRGASVGNVIEINLRCNHKVDEKTCGQLIPFTIDINDLKVVHNENHTDKIEVVEGIGCVMKYPSLESIDKMGNMSAEDVQAGLFDIVADSIKSIWDGDTVQWTKDLPKEEVREFLESMTTSQFQKFVDFFDTMPAVKHTLTGECPKCKNPINHDLKGIKDFFG